jgi:hypothetical protein
MSDLRVSRCVSYNILVNNSAEWRVGNEGFE